MIDFIWDDRSIMVGMQKIAKEEYFPKERMGVHESMLL